MTPEPPPGQLATVLPHHLALALWSASQVSDAIDPRLRTKAIEHTTRAIRAQHPEFFRKEDES